MNESDLEKFEKLCCDYGHKSSSIFRIEFDRMKSLKSKLELQLEQSKFAAGLHEENNKMLETISKQRIDNEMYERENKSLIEDQLSHGVTLDNQDIKINNLKEKIEKAQTIYENALKSGDHVVSSILKEILEEKS